MAELKINAVAFQEGDAWVIQGIEYDIVAHTYKMAAAPHVFMRAVIENILITEHMGRRPLEGIKPAPEHFRQLFEDAQTEMRPTKRDPRADISVRVSELA